MNSSPRDPTTPPYTSLSNPDMGDFSNPITGTSSGNPYPFLDPPMASGEIGWLNQYRVIQLLGAGGMGYVFEAEDTHLRRPIALKVMKPELAADYGFRERFLGEARAAAALHSDHVVTVFQVGTAKEVPFLAMQLLLGQSLQDRLEREAPLPVNLAATIALQAADGLGVAHNVGLVHRDIKPANLWLESDRPNGAFRRVRILDFGLARAYDQDSRLTATGVIVGTPHFMAPEQANGQIVDGRADLFSLGCVMYTMLTGELPFDGPSTMAVLMALANHHPTPVNLKNPEVPQQLSDLIARMMSKQRDIRPAAAFEVIEVLDAVISSLPPIATPLPGHMSGGVGMSQINRNRTSSPVPRSMGGRGGVLSGVRSAHTETPSQSAHVTASMPSSSRSGVPSPGSGAVPPGGSDFLARRGLLVGTAIGAIAVAVVLSVMMLGNKKPSIVDALPPGEPIPVGVLHSTTGTMALSESPVVDATMLAINEVNAAGGVLGRQLKAVELDGKSDEKVFSKGAEQLLVESKVPVIFGCWTSASRKAVREQVERHDGVLFYPVQYEGLETSPRVVYLGPTANQQLFPAIDFLTQILGKKKIFLIGSDYVYPRSAHEVIKDEIKSRKGTNVEIVGENFLPLGAKASDVLPIIEAIQKAEPDAIINTINGSTNYPFFRELEAAGAPWNDIPVMSFSVMETDLTKMDPKDIAGHYIAGTYFQSVDSPAGREFLNKIRARYGPERSFSDPMAAAYSGVHLWAQAANKAKDVKSSAVLNSIRGMTFAGPDGTIKIDSDNLHAWLPIRIGKIQPDGSVTSVYGSREPIRPVPFPPTRTRIDWDRFLAQMYEKWDGQWQAPPMK